MLARRLPSILPPLTLEEALETTKIHSIAGLLASDQAIPRSVSLLRNFPLTVQRAAVILDVHSEAQNTPN